MKIFIHKPLNRITLYVIYIVYKYMYSYVNGHYFIQIMSGMHAGPDLWCSDSIACLAVSGESEAEPGAFLTGANSEPRATSMSDTR